MRIPVRSRIGNVFLGAIGVIYIVAAVSLLVFAIVQTWNAQSMMDWAVQLVLVAAAAVGVFFVATARGNLGRPIADLNALRHSRPNRRAAEASS